MIDNQFLHLLKNQKNISSTCKVAEKNYQKSMKNCSHFKLALYCAKIQWAINCIHFFGRFDGILFLLLIFL